MEEQLAPRGNHQSSASSRSCFCQYLPAILRRSSSDGPLYNAWPPGYLLLWTRNYLVRLPGDSVTTNPVPYAPWHHIQTHHHVGDIYLTPLQQYGPISYRVCYSIPQDQASHIKPFYVRVLDRLLHL